MKFESAFDKDDMLISLSIADKSLKELEEKLNENLKIYKEDTDKLINEMKSYSKHSGYFLIYDWRFGIGTPTDYYSNGIRLYAGDEVEFINGKRGVVTVENGLVMVRTNAEMYQLISQEEINEMRVVFASFEGYVTGDRLKIAKHFNTLIDGEEIANGRKGAKGFIVHLD